MRNQKPLVSVNMCTIRSVPRWELLLDSMEQQTFKDFEYIIVDGLYNQRKDEVEKILKDYSFPITYVKDKFWYHSEEEKFGTRPGLPSARNTGVIHARGKLIVWHDDNTWLPPDWLSRHVQAFKLDFDGMAGLSYGSWAKPHKMSTFSDLIKDHREDYNGNKIPIIDEKTHEITYQYNMLPTGWLYGSNMSIRTEYILKINGFPEEFCGQMGSEDCFTAICLQRAGAKLVLDKKCFVIHFSDEHHVGFNDMFKFKNTEVRLRDGRMHFSNEKFVEDLLFKETTRHRNNPHFNLSSLRNEKLAELYG